MNKRGGVLIAGLIAVFAVCAAAAPSWAQPPKAHPKGKGKDKAAKVQVMNCEVVEIDATTAEKPLMDPDLKDLAKKLTKGPFSGFNKFTKLARESRKLEVLKSERYDTPKGAVDVIIREMGQATKKKRARLQLGIRLENESGKQYLDAKQNVDAGDYVLFARTVSATQTIVTAVGCK